MKRYALMILLFGAELCSMEKDHKDTNLLNCLITIYRMDKIEEQLSTASPEIDAFKHIVLKQAGKLTQELSKDRLISILEKAQLYVSQPLSNSYGTKLVLRNKVKID
jgi:uncharacterized protein YehS (DUF1456 family)